MKIYKMSFLAILGFIIFLGAIIIFLWFLAEYQIFERNNVIVYNQGDYLEFYKNTNNPNLINTVIIEMDKNEMVLEIISHKNIKDDLFSFKINVENLPKKYWNINLFNGEIFNPPINFLDLIFNIN